MSFLVYYARGSNALFSNCLQYDSSLLKRQSIRYHYKFFSISVFALSIVELFNEARYICVVVSD